MRAVQTRALLYLATLSSSLAEALVTAEEAVGALPAASARLDTAPAPGTSAAGSSTPSGSSAAVRPAAGEQRLPGVHNGDGRLPGTALDAPGAASPRIADMRQRRQAAAEEQEALIARGGGMLQVAIWLFCMHLWVILHAVMSHAPGWNFGMC